MNTRGTEQAGLPDVVVAPSWRRALAGLAGWSIGLAFWTGAIVAFVTLDPDPPAAQPWNLLDRIVDYLQARPSVLWVAFAAAVVAAIGVPFLFLWRGWRLPGMRLTRLALIDARGAKPTPTRSLGWLAARFLGVGLGGLSLYWSLVDRDRRTLHDRIAGVWVVQDVTATGRPSPPRDPLRTSEARVASARSEPTIGSWGAPTDRR